MPVINGIYLKDFTALPDAVADANIIPIAISGNQVAYRTTVGGIVTDARVTGKLLTGLSVTGGAVVSTDSILTAFGKVQNQVNNKVPYTGATGAVDLGPYDLTVNSLRVGRGAGGVASNTALGSSALRDNTTGSLNTAIGNESLLLNTTGANNTGVGAKSLKSNINGASNAAFGLNALETNSTGSNNTSIGMASLNFNTTGGNNVAIGQDAAKLTSAGANNLISNDSVFIGQNSRPFASNQENQIVIGFNTYGNGSNTVTIGNSSITNNYFTGNIRGGAFIKSGGLSTEFLKADGSVDSNTYALASSLTGYVTLDTAQTITGAKTLTALLTGTRANFTSSGSGDTMIINHSSGSGIGLSITKGGNGEGIYVNKTSGSGNAVTIVGTLNATTLVKNGGTSSQFLKADGSVDSTSYQPLLTNPVTGTGTTNYLPKFTGASSIGNSNLINDANGTLGLGVTPSAWDGTLVKAIQLADNGASLSSFSTGNTSGKFAILSNNAYYDSGGWKYLQSSASAQYRIANQEHQWYTAPSGTAGNAISFTQAMTLDASGRLGIGTTSPQGIFEAVGLSYLTRSGQSLLINPNYGGANTHIQFQAVGNMGIAFATNGDNERMRITSGGNVGIGTTSPLSISGFTALEVKGTSAGTVCVSSGGGSAFGRLYTAGSTVIVGTSTNHPLILDTNDTERMRITSGGQLMVNTTLGLGGTIIVANRSGNAGINVFDAQGNGSLVQFYNSGAVQIGSITTDGSSTAYNTTSDYRLKQDLKDYSGLSLVNNIKTYDYEWKSDKTRMYGVIAHELQEIIPYAIHGEKDAEEMQSVDYSKLVPVLVKAIQEQQAQIEELKALINK